jgi:hypothetical protein
MVDEYAYTSSRCVQKCVQIFMSTVSHVSSVLSKSETASHTMPHCKLHAHPFANFWVHTRAQTNRAMIFTGTSQGFRHNWNKYLFILTKHKFNQLNCPHMYATCFAMYLGHPEACKLKNICRKKQQKSNRPLLTFTVFIVL